MTNGIRKPIPADDLWLKSVDIWKNQWFILMSGDFKKGDFNAMTVAWGSIGCMWEKPFVQIVVRPTRYTYEFTERYDTFTLNAFPRTFKKAVLHMGTKSGRDGDKIKDAGLTPMASEQVVSPCFKEAALVIECRKIYWDDMNPQQFIDPTIQSNYSENDYHRIYFGEILAVQGTAQYQE